MEFTFFVFSQILILPITLKPSVWGDNPIPRPFSTTEDITSKTAPNCALAPSAVDDPTTSSQIYTICHSLRIPVNITDAPSECDFYFGNIHRDGPLQVVVSTNGNGPKLAGEWMTKVSEAWSLEELGGMEEEEMERLLDH